MAVNPNWWTVMQATEADGGIGLETIRGGSRNPMPDPYLVAELLWKDEALSILDELGLAKGWRAKRIKLIHQRLADELSFSDLSGRVRSSLKARDGWLGQRRSHEFDMPVKTNSNPML